MNIIHQIPNLYKVSYILILKNNKKIIKNLYVFPINNITGGPL